VDSKQQLIFHARSVLVRFAIVSIIWCIGTAAVIAALSYRYLVEVVAVARVEVAAFRAGGGMEPRELLQQHSQLLLGGVGLAAASAIIAIAGILLMQRTLGRNRRTPIFVLAACLALPHLGTIPGLSYVAATNATVMLLVAGFGLAIGNWMMQIPLMLFWFNRLWLAYRRARMRFDPVEADELSVSARRYCDSFEAEMLEAGYLDLGYQRCRPHSPYFRRLWVNPSHTIYASAVWISGNDREYSALSIASVSEDGTYFETSSLASASVSIPADIAHSMTYVPGGSGSEVLLAHEQNLIEWLNQSGRLPLQIEPKDEPQLCDYGRAYFAKARRDMTWRDQLIWLSFPFSDFEPPIPRGTPWTPSQAVEMMV
jgi:hypothetical protein